MDFLAYANYGGVYTDFRSMRHAFITNLAKAIIAAFEDLFVYLPTEL